VLRDGGNGIDIGPGLFDDDRSDKNAVSFDALHAISQAFIAINIYAKAPPVRVGAIVREILSL